MHLTRVIGNSSCQCVSLHPIVIKVCVRSHLTFNIAIELIKPKLLLITKITPKLSLQSCPPSVANTTLGICYICVALCCSAHGYCAVEFSVACCAAKHTAIATSTLPRTRLVAHQSTQQYQPNTLTNTLTPWGLVGHQGMPKE